MDDLTVCILHFREIFLIYRNAAGSAIILLIVKLYGLNPASAYNFLEKDLPL